MRRLVLLVLAAASLCSLAVASAADAPAYRSHPPLRQAPAPQARPRQPGPSYFVDPAQGKDDQPGSETQPWRTLAHALAQLKAGDTLYLRGGVYYERAYVALAGLPDKPITIRGYPGETAILDAALPEFSRSPATAWQPVPDGAPGEFRSAQRYPNLRDVAGSFGDSQVGLQTYYHAQDLRATGELNDWLDWERTQESDLKPIYLGPGVWYDRQTGYIHVRLAHTHLPPPVPNYQGETDPRRLPLVLAPFGAIALHLDKAEHVRVQDLVIRGGGYVTVQLDQAHDIELDQLTIWAGGYGLRAVGTERLKLTRSGVHGNVAPWTFRADASKRDYPGRPHRNLSRLNTHALIEIDNGRESSVFYTPQNDDWEIAYCDFTDAHDGVYLGSINIRFHHNRIENLQDDGIYLSPMYLRHRLDNRDPELHIYQNEFRRLLTALAFGGTETSTADRVFVYRNVFDLREPVLTGRPSVRKAEPGLSTGKLIGDHGSPPWSALALYHNTIIAGGARDAAMAAFGAGHLDRPRQAFNNIFLHVDRLPGLTGPDPARKVIGDGNLYWAPGTTDKQAAALFAKFRVSPALAESRQLYPPGSEASSLVADPLLTRFVEDPDQCDYRPAAGSPAVGKGVRLPEGLVDALPSEGPPDIGAWPAKGPGWKVGRQGAK